jgi:Zn-dependent protease/CBS domain-containing protein
MAAPTLRERDEAASTRPAGGLNLGTLFGIRIHVDYSLFVIAALVTFNLGGGVFPAWHPEWSPVLRWTVALGAAILFFGSILAHELAHAVVGRHLGIPMGGITLFLFGGMAHMEREPERPRAEFLMAAVGPLTSVLIGVAAAFAGAALAGEQFTRAGDEVTAARLAGPLATLLLWLGPVNVFLGLFNLVPGFPLDGGRMLRALVWWITGSYQKATSVATFSGQAVAALLIACGLLMTFGVRVPALGSGPAQGLWLVLIGWFLNTAARTSQRQTIVLTALEGVPVERLMQRGFEAVEPDTRLGDLVYQRLLRERQRCYPVVRGEKLEGLICLQDVRKVPESRWNATPVSAVMTPVHRVSALGLHDSSAEALRRLGQYSVDQLPVIDEQGRLAGLIRREDLVRWLALSAADRDASGGAPTALGEGDLRRYP